MTWGGGQNGELEELSMRPSKPKLGKRDGRHVTPCRAEPYSRIWYLAQQPQRTLVKATDERIHVNLEYFEYFFHVQSYSRTKKEKAKKQANQLCKKTLIVINITIKQEEKQTEKEKEKPQHMHLESTSL